MGVEILTVHTADLNAATLAAAKALLVEVFEGELTEEDWEHCLGGMHALALDGDEVVGHASVVQRRLLHDGRALRAGYVEGVAVRGDRRRTGTGAALMRELERIIRGAYDVGALGTTDMAIPFYESLGWRRWDGPTYALTTEGIKRTEDEDGSVYVLECGVPLDLDGDIACDFREGDGW